MADATDNAPRAEAIAGDGTPETDCDACSLPARVIIRSLDGHETPPLCIRHAIDTLQQIVEVAARQLDSPGGE